MGFLDSFGKASKSLISKTLPKPSPTGFSAGAERMAVRSGLKKYVDVDPGGVNKNFNASGFLPKK